MPKFFYEEWALQEWASYAEDEDAPPDSKIALETQLARLKREDDGQFSEYQAASCPLDEEKLDTTARLALQSLRDLGVTQLFVRYDGGNDEGFAYFESAKTPDREWMTPELIGQFEAGPLGEKPENSIYDRFFPERIPQMTRANWTAHAVEGLAGELAVQLLGRGFGTGEYSLEGRFVADLTNNTLTDIPPLEGG